MLRIHGAPDIFTDHLINEGQAIIVFFDCVRWRSYNVPIYQPWATSVQVNASASIQTTMLSSGETVSRVAP